MGIEFIQDDDRLREERKKAKKNKDKYVGMSSDSMGFRGGSGFESGWQDKWPNSGVTGGSWGKDADKNKGGYQDNSDDDDNNAHRGYSPDPGSEYKDTEAVDDNKRFSSVKVGSTLSNNNQFNTSSDKTTGDSKKKTVNKVRKPIDLGAAATFAANASSAQPSNNSTQNNVSNKSTTNFDLFSTDDDTAIGNNAANNSNQYQQPSSLVITGNDDDFDPRSFGRATASNNNSSSNNGNNFGFGNSVNSPNDGQDGDFADFSSAFGGATSSCDNNTNKTDQNLFGSGIPAPPSPKETTPGGDFDLFGGSSTVPSNPAQSSNLDDLLGGLGSGAQSLTSMPNLMSAPPAGTAQPSEALFGGH